MQAQSPGSPYRVSSLFQKKKFRKTVKEHLNSTLLLKLIQNTINIKLSSGAIAK